MIKNRRAFWLHLLVYILTNIAIFFLNSFYSPEDVWVFYSLIGWGIAIIIHYLASS